MQGASLLLLVGVVLANPESCIHKWTANCSSEQTPASCNACTKGLYADCTPALMLAVDSRVCTQAPLGPQTLDCINTASKLCAPLTKSKAECRDCVLQNGVALKSANCTYYDETVMNAICDTI
jgi:hypothetical protein